MIKRIPKFSNFFYTFEDFNSKSNKKHVKLKFSIYFILINIYKIFKIKSKKLFKKEPPKKKPFGLFNPYSTFEMVWNLIEFLIVVIFSILIPIQICFKVNIMDENINILIRLYFGLGFLINVNTSYYYHGVLVESRLKIFKNYLKTKFLFDFVSLVPIYFFNRFDFKNFFFLTRVFIQKEFIQSIKLHFITQKKNKLLYEIFCKFIFSLFIIHIFACLWYWAGSTGYSKLRSSWLREKKIENEDIYIKLLFSYYWSATTILTVGYGDISPKNEKEVILATITILIGCYVFAYNINSFGTFLNDYQKLKKIIELLLIFILELL